MARQYANIKLSIWSDDDFRTLSPPAQHLYFVLMTSPSLSHCGIADWRPGRIAALAGGWTRAAVEQAAAELVRRLYIVIDEATEEVLVRSFVRHDEIMKQPKMAVSMANAHAAAASAVLRGIIVHELRRLYEEFPELHGWNAGAASALLAKTPIDPSTYPLGGGPSGGPDSSRSGSPKGKPTPNSTPSGSGSVNGSPSPAPIPAPATSNQHHAAATQRATANADAPSQDALLDDPPRKVTGFLPEQRVAQAVYDATHGMVKFSAVQGVAKQALAKIPGATVETVTTAMQAIYASSKPITLETVGQRLNAGGGVGIKSQGFLRDPDASFGMPGSAA